PTAGAHAVIDEIGHAARRQQENAQQMRRSMDELSITAENRDGSVKVSVDANGGLADLEISRAAMKLGHEGLRDEILRGTRAARHRLTERVGRITADAFGKDSATALKMRETYAEAFGTPDKTPHRRVPR
ncbi:MAG: YbaB/EbfC family nucleoid-associated protein, partial [Stackebrandtia sp.]